MPDPSALEVLRDAGRAVARARDVDEVFSVGLDAMMRVLGSRRAALLLFDDDGVLRYRAWRGLSDAFRVATEGRSPWTPDDEAPRPIAVRDVAAAEQVEGLRDVLRDEGIRALAFVPLVHGRRLLGKFTVHFDAPRDLAPDELVTAEILGNQVAFAVAAYQAEAATRLREDETRFLLEASRVLAGSLDVDTTLERIAELAVPRLADWCAVKLVEPDGSVRRAATRHRDPARFALAQEILRRFPMRPDQGEGRAIVTGAPVLVPFLPPAIEGADIPEDARRSLRALGLTSLLIAPLKARGRVLGVLTLIHGESGRHFDEHDVCLADDLAGRAATAVDNARLYEERKRAEDDAAGERERLLVTLRSIGDAVIATDGEGRVTLLNGVAEKLTGWTWDEARGRHLPEVFRIYAETGDAREDPVARVLAEGTVVGLAAHTVIEARDGRRRAIADSAAPIRTPSGDTLGVVLVFRDVTDQQRVELELARASKLESLGVLAGGIAHDFNNILTAIVTNISLAEALLAEDHAARKRLTAANRACMRARDLTRQLLTFSRGGAPVKTRVDVGALLRESCAFALQGSRTRASYEIPDDLWRIDADAAQVAQVVHNLVLNAAQAMPEGGHVVASARNVDIEPGADLPLSPGRYVRVSVADTGPGVAPELVDRIFDPFFTTKPGGTGLGLATTHSIVQRHGGHVSVSAAPGGGAVFHVWLPAAASEAGEERPARPATPARGRVLVMDDDAELRTLAAECLAHLGYDCDVAEDGRHAVEMFAHARREGRPYAVVILDLTVPGGMGGRDALARMRQEDPAVRAIVSSGYSNDPVLARFAEHGFAAAIQKPWALPDLERVLAAVLAEPAMGPPVPA